MRYLFAIVAALSGLLATAQKILPTPRNIEAAYTRETRSVSGSPGKNYWQNTADYDLRINYNPVTRLLAGVVDISYTNNSPDTLKEVWFKLYQNLYKQGTPRQVQIEPADLGEGVVIDSLRVNALSVATRQLRVNGTNARLGGQSVASGETIRFRMVWHFTLNKGSHMRTGEIEPNAAFIAYFFPRVAVYDDIDGWNKFAYNGSQEFYNDFGNYKAAITVPKDFVVWATGDLRNGDKVLGRTFYQRLQQAESSDAVVTIIDSTDLEAGRITADNPYNTWLFEAANVTDFAFALSDHYIWKSTSLVVDPKTGRRTRVDAAFNQQHADYFHVVYDARKTVETMSYSFPAWPFPYPHITVFDGLDQMEYPMMVNDNPVNSRRQGISLTSHEVFHTIFPFYMGTNETKYAWMDEGWATVGEWFVSHVIDSSFFDTYGVGPYSGTAGTENDLPVMTPSTELTRGYFTNSYPKPAMGYLYVRDYLGDVLFTKALHHYIRQWQGRHPVPNDFFYSMNEGSGKNLNWFWKKWFFDDGVPDLAIASAKKHSGNKMDVMVVSKGSKPVPVDLVIYYNDKTTDKLHRDISVWEKGESRITLTITTFKPVVRLELTAPQTPDSNPADNLWEVK